MSLCKIYMTLCLLSVVIYSTQALTPSQPGVSISSLPVQLNCNGFCEALKYKGQSVITCYPPDQEVVIVNEGERTAIVSWHEFTVIPSANTNVSQVLPGSQWPGDRFGVGIHRVLYYVKDGYGHTDSCTFQFEVTATECPFPPLPAGTTLTCPNIPEGSFPVWGESCVVGCAAGFTITTSATVRVCQMDGTFGGERFDVCSAARKPVINNCPPSTSIYVSADQQTARASWTDPTAVDVNGNAIIVTQPHGITRGTQLQYNRSEPLKNVHSIVFTASDYDGNMAVPCVFSITVKELVCPSIELTPHLIVNCTEPTTYGAHCFLSCNSTHIRRGLDEVWCEKDSSTDPESAYWNWGPMGTTYCEAADCPALKQPENGELNCVPMSTGSYCSMNCSEGYDRPRNAEAEWVCDRDAGGWQLDRNYVPDCISKVMAENIQHPNTLYYHSADCLQTTQDTLLAEVKVIISNTGFQTACPATHTCSVADLSIKGCSPNRNKRDLSYRMEVTFNLDITMNYPAVLDVDSLLLSLEDGLYAMANIIKTEVTSGNFTVSGYDLQIYLYDPNSVDIYLVCGQGLVGRWSTFTCAGCPKGTMYDVNSDGCTLCPAGYYQDMDHQFTCKQCPVGSSTSLEGATNSQQCIELCPAGQYSSNGIRPCYLCPEFTYQNQSGQVACIRCPINVDATATGLTSQQQCTDTVCSSDLVCGMSGRCIPSASDPRGYLCMCDSGVIATDHCENCNYTPCVNGGSCMSGSGACSCTPGYYGHFCQDNPGQGVTYGEWGPWSCNVTCGSGTETRYRISSLGGLDYEYQPCNLPQCPACRDNAQYSCHQRTSDEQQCNFVCSTPGYIAVNGGHYMCGIYTNYLSPVIDTGGIVCSKSSVPSQLILNIYAEVPSQSAKTPLSLVWALVGQTLFPGIPQPCFTEAEPSVDCPLTVSGAIHPVTGVYTITVQEMFDINLPGYFPGGQYDVQEANRVLSLYSSKITEIENSRILAASDTGTDPLLQQYQPTNVRFSSYVICPANMIQVHLLCGECEMGYHVVDNRCVTCEQGMYWNGQQCLQCVDNSAGQLPVECAGPLKKPSTTSSPVEGGGSMVPYIAGPVAGVFVLVIIAIIIIAVIIYTRNSDKVDNDYEDPKKEKGDPHIYNGINISNRMDEKSYNDEVDIVGYETPQFFKSSSPEDVTVYDEIPEKGINKLSLDVDSDMKGYHSLNYPQTGCAKDSEVLGIQQAVSNMYTANPGY